ncbi:MAG: hypothetical protein VB119_10765 [Candidatus Metalachnospira sp.]|nr:hypothetical protein [Candidatus Metalachnospira sp.]
MESIKDLTNPNSDTNREKIAAAILQDTGNTDIYNAADATSVRVNYGNIIGNGNNDAVITVCFGSDNCIMTVYTLGENGYEYSGGVAHFSGVDNIKIFRPNGAANDVILFRERSNQSVGALENSSILRAYFYLNGKFKNVLSFDENLESWWNDCYHEGVKKWCRVIQTSKVNAIEDYKTITVVKDQVFSTSDKHSSRIRPVDSDFLEQAKRTITETYYWDNDWGLYMLAKKIEKSTGEVVAVLQDYGNSPYVLSGDIFNKYKILRDDGSVAIVDYNDLEDIPQNAGTTTPGTTAPETTAPVMATPEMATPEMATPGTTTPGTTVPETTTPGTTTPEMTTQEMTTPANNRSANNRWSNNRRPNNSPR